MLLQRFGAILSNIRGKKKKYGAFGTLPLVNALLDVWAVSVAPGKLYTGWSTKNEKMSGRRSFHAEKGG